MYVEFAKKGLLVVNKNKRKYVTFIVIVFVSSSFILYLINKIHGEASIKERQTASARGPASLNSSMTLYTHEIEQTTVQIMKEARDLSNNKYYTQANVLLSEFLRSNFTHPLAEEAYFLLAQGLFEEEQFSESKQVVQNFQEQESDSVSIWMGRSLLILAQIYVKTGEIDEAIRLYRRIISEFSDEDLVEQAEDLLIGLSL